MIVHDEDLDLAGALLFGVHNQGRRGDGKNVNSLEKSTDPMGQSFRTSAGNDVLNIDVRGQAHLPSGKIPAD